MSTSVGDAFPSLKSISSLSITPLISVTDASRVGKLGHVLSKRRPHGESSAKAGESLNTTPRNLMDIPIAAPPAPRVMSSEASIDFAR